MIDYPDHLGLFLRRCGERMEQGRRVYGRESFGRTPRELLEELQQELIDQANWAYINFARVEEMKRKLCKRCGWPIVYVQGEAKRDDGLCAQCHLQVKPTKLPEKEDGRD